MQAVTHVCLAKGRWASWGSHGGVNLLFRDGSGGAVCSEAISDGGGELQSIAA